MNPHTKTFGVGVKWPTLCILRTRYPDLAGVLMRDWERDGLLVRYRYHRRRGFFLMAVRPRWAWVLRLLFWWGGWR